MTGSRLRIGTPRLMLLSTCLCFWIDAIAADGLVKAVPEADTQLIANATAVDITRTPGRRHEGYNVAFLYGMGQSADVKTLLMGSDVLPGIYRVDIYANNTLVGRQDVVFSENPKSGEVEACFSEDLLKQVGINTVALHSEGKLKADTDCYRLPDLIDQAGAVYDSPRLRLNLSVPQAAMTRERRGYVDPSVWDSGVSLGFVNYNLNSRYDYSSSNESRQSTNLGLRMGLNVGDWRLRNNSSQTSSTGQPSKFTSQNTYLQRDITGLKSQLWLGETYTNSPLFDGVRFRGVQMASDEGMSPDSEQGYAPVIRGNAESNATVEVRQNNYLIYSANVSPGPFEITDLSPSGSNGDLEVTIIEADGRRRVMRQAFSSPPLMVREGRLLYDATLGEFQQDYGSSERPVFANGSMMYGLTSDLTLASGLQAASGFQAYSMGAGINTRIGAVSLDGTQSHSSIEGTSKVGQRLRLRYAKFIESTNTNVSVNAQRSLNENFRSLSDHVYASSAAQGHAWYSSEFPDYSSTSSAYSRTRLDVYLAQNLGKDNRFGSVYLNGSDDRYWNNSSSRSYSAGYSNSWRSLSYNVGVTHAQNVSSSVYNSRYSDTTLTLSLSFPLGGGERPPQVFMNSSRQQGGDTSLQTGVTGTLPSDRDVNYSVVAGRGADGTGNGSASVGSNTSVGNMTLGYSYGNQYHSTSLQANGAIVAHAGGVNLAQPLSETFALVKVEPRMADVPVASYSGVKTGANGYAVVPNATPYRANWLGLSANGMSPDVEIDTAMQQVVPRRGAAALATFKSSSGRRVQFELFRPDGKLMPFGATVDHDDGQRLGIADPRGRVLALLSDEQTSGELLISWDNNQCRVRFALPEKKAGENYQSISLKCNAVTPTPDKPAPAPAPAPKKIKSAVPSIAFYQPRQ
jgi:outer membrane usher protein